MTPSFLASVCLQKLRDPYISGIRIITTILFIQIINLKTGSFIIYANITFYFE